MDYNQTIEFLFSQLKEFQVVGASAYKSGLENSIELDNYFGHQHRLFKTIHVAGTNGKGSTSHSIASVLQHAGYKVGLYTSPHLRDFRERIRVNGQMVDKQFVVDFVANHQRIIQQIRPSFFEMTVFMAFNYFAQQKVDVAVIEVGLGGRLDSTNVITPVLSVITNIAFDHVQILGDTLPKIAAEKAGIIKPGVPVVVSQTQAETANVFSEKAAECGSPIVFADQMWSVQSAVHQQNRLVLTVEKNTKVEYANLQLDLCGDYQKKNILGVLAAIEQLRSQFEISDKAIELGLSVVAKTTGLCGRWQTLQTNPTMVCDTGHNEDGIRQVVAQLAEQQYTTLRIVFGMVSDKDHSHVLGLLPKDAVYYFTRANIPRALPQDELAQKAATFGLQGKTYQTVADAVAAAVADSKPTDFIYIGGSTFVVADIPDLYFEQ